MKNKKTIIILAILIVLIGGIFLVNNIYQNKNKAEVSKTKRKKQNNLAILIKEDGATDYTKSSSKDIPKGNYTLNRDKSYCKNNGVIGDYDSTLGKVSFSFVGTDSCFLYFDYKATYLYDTIEQRYNEDKTYLGLYTGEESDTYKNKVYYYKDNVQDNNVLFAGFCWKIVRTTETGGVKLIYNGVQTDGSCNNTGTDSQIGTSTYNNYYNSPAYVGYMYNIVYNSIYKNASYSSDLVLRGGSGASILYGNSVTYSNGMYTLTDTNTITSGYASLVGKYICGDLTSSSCKNPYYILRIANQNFAYIPQYVILDYGITDGTMMTSLSFGASFTYENGKYYLSDTIKIDVSSWSSTNTNLNTHHYSCLYSGTVCEKLFYVYYTDTNIYFIELTGGKSIDDALNEMLYSNNNFRIAPSLKYSVDNWYKNNLNSYTNKLEDTVFCNDRSMSNKETNGWYPNGGNIKTLLQFKNYAITDSLKCSNQTDKFTVNTSNGNGALTYPVGLLTAPEAKLANYGSSNYLNSGSTYWLLTPAVYSNMVASMYVLTSSNFNVDTLAASLGVRPVISLKSKISISSGDGSFTSPFVIN